MFGIDLFDASLVPAILVAFAAGILSFLSPCVLPIVPPYLAYMGGITMAEIDGDARSARRKALTAALFFVLGLSTVFVFLGFTASIFGQFFLQNQILLGVISGFIIYLFGLHFIGFRHAFTIFFVVIAGLLLAFIVQGVTQNDGLGSVVGSVVTGLSALTYKIGALFALTVVVWLIPYDGIPLLNREARLDAGDRGGSAFGAYILGLAFAFGWTPCIGPQLGAILSIAATESSVSRGTGLLAVYAVGLSIPFLLAAGFIDRAMGVMNRLKRHMKTIERVMGLLLVGVGVALMTGAFSAFSFWLLETFPALGALG